MGLAAIRRALIGVVVLGIFLDGMAILVAKGVFSKAPPPKSYNIVAKIEKLDAATRLKKQLEQAGFQPTLTKEKGDKKVPSGYRLVLENKNDPGSLAPIAKALRLTHHKIDWKPGDTKLLYGVVFPKKAAADKAAEKISRTEGFKFLVREETKTVVMAYQRVDLKNLSNDKSDEAQKILEAGGAEVAVEEAAPAVSEAGSAGSAGSGP